MSFFLCNIWKVEHGSAAFILTPSGKTIMMDAGCSDDFSPSQHLTSYGIDKIDCLIVSHPHGDHINDLPSVIGNMKPESLLRNKKTPNRLVFKNGTSNLSEPHNSWHKMITGYSNTISSDSDESIYNKNFNGGLDIKVYSNGEADLSGSAKENLNNYSLLTTIKYEDLLLVFPGDLEPAGWDAILDKNKIEQSLGGNTKILIAPHHGRASGVRLSDKSIYSRFLEMMNPNLTIISDIHGNETTDPEAYRRYCCGYDVFCDDACENRKVLTTKRNNCVTIQVNSGVTTVKVL